MRTVDMIAVTPEQLEEIKTFSYNSGRRSVAIDRNKKYKRTLEKVKYTLGMTAILVLPPALMMAHYLTFGY